MSGSYQYFRCNSGGRGYTHIGSGNAKSADVAAKGAVDCSTSPPSTSLGYQAKQLYC